MQLLSEQGRKSRKYLFTDLDRIWNSYKYPGSFTYQRTHFPSHFEASKELYRANVKGNLGISDTLMQGFGREKKKKKDHGEGKKERKIMLIGAGVYT